MNLRQQSEKIIEDVKKLGGTVRVSHQGRYDGRRETSAKITIGEKEYYGCAQVSDKDRFNKKMGRAIALGRAWKKYDEKLKE